jgi:hypothetical protein
VTRPSPIPEGLAVAEYVNGVGVGVGVGEDTPQVEHKQLGEVVPSTQRIFPPTPQLFEIPPWPEQQPGH